MFRLQTDFKAFALALGKQSFIKIGHTLKSVLKAGKTKFLICHLFAFGYMMADLRACP